MNTQTHLPNLNEHYEVVVSMLSEIEGFQKELEAINENLLAMENNASSEYGSRILESRQSKLFYLQRLLRRSTHKLREHQELLEGVISGVTEKSEAELNEYISYCHETATRVQDRLTKYKKENKRTFEAYGW